MITPRRTRLLRVAGLAGLRHLLTRQLAALDPIAAADTFVLVPTRAAAEQLRRTVEDAVPGPQAAIPWPRSGPRADLYRELVSRAPQPLDMLSPFDREVTLGRIAREVSASGLGPPFAIRPALVAEMLALYDHVRRQARTVDDFDRNLRAELEPAADTDRGARQLLRQTAFLTAVFEGYERYLTSVGLADEHAVREALVAQPSARPLRHVIVAVADRVADPDGLWPVDFTLLSTLPHLERVDVVATEAQLAAGWLERVHAALPELEEVPAERGQPADDAARRPVLVVPAADGPLAFASRDREDELAQVARRLKAARRAGDHTPLHRHALVVRRPLPYLYLARSAFGGAGIPFETLDTLPLAAEPYAAALDVVLDFVGTGFSRVSAVALLRSPHFHFQDGGDDLPAEAVTALDRALSESRYLGGLDRLERLAQEWSAITAPATRGERRRHAAGPAARASVALAQGLLPLTEAGPVASQLAVLQRFLDRHHREPAGDADIERLARVRRAVIGAIGALARAYRDHDPDATATGGELASAIRRWLGAQTFAARAGVEGVRVLDAQAARFADVDDVQLAGLVDGEWPERSRRSIFYPPFLLGLLDPTPAAEDPNKRESDQMAAARATFLDLLGLAGRRVRVSTFALESDAVVEPSSFLDDLATAGLERTPEAPVTDLAVSADELLTQTPQTPQMLLGPLAMEWVRLRAAAPGSADARYQGEAGPWTFARISVSRVDRYLKCPFQFFATEVLELEEEPEDEDAPPPWERGRFLHALFEAFFREWQARGHGSITADRVPEARGLLVALSERALETIAPTEATLERARLFGSAASAGIIDRVLSMEAARPGAIDRRLIEFELDDGFVFRRDSGETRVVPLRAKVDRVDLLADGTFRVIDYKSKLLPDPKRTVQLQIYTSAVAQQLAKAGDRHRAPSEAFYLSMEGTAPVRALRPAKGQGLDDVLRAAEDRMVQAIDDARAGHFPPRPVPRSLCSTCPYDTVCRKAFVEVADE